MLDPQGWIVGLPVAIAAVVLGFARLVRNGPVVPAVGGISVGLIELLFVIAVAIAISSWN